MCRRAFRLGLLSSTVLLLAASGCAGDDSTEESGTSGLGDGDGDGSGDGDGDGDGSGDGDGDGDGTGDGDGDGDGGVRYDVLGFPDSDGNTGPCDEPCGEDEFSYIWIANSPENTVTKLNTRTLVEEGRYQTRPDGGGNPSRTSVSVDGRAAVIANRYVGITKIWANAEDCEDKNDNDQIDTSTGPLDVLPFDQEECIAWHNDFPGATVQRPVAWTTGEWSTETCQFENQKVWVTSATGGGQGSCSDTGFNVHRLNGDTGEIEDTVWVNQPCTSLGPYGGAVDYDGNFWFYVWGGFKVVRVDFETLAVDIRSGGFYGLTVDTEARVWVDAPRRYDYEGDFWEDAIGDLPANGGTGIAQDLQGRMWSGTTDGVGWVDMETMVVGDSVQLPGGGRWHGVSVDIDGYIWAVSQQHSVAYKIDPDTYELDYYDNLTSPYTYSDMTGGQIANVSCNPPPEG